MFRCWRPQDSCFSRLSSGEVYVPLLEPPRFLFLMLVLLRESILDLHMMFECGGGWGLERTFDRWIGKQSWRHALPTSFFELHAFMVKL